MTTEIIKDTNVLTAELLKLERKHRGQLTAQTVVDAARSVKSPLHKHFEWEDTKAAEEYRLWQARQLVSIVKYKHPEMDNEVRMFTSVFVKKEIDGEETSIRYYTRTESALANSELRAQILARAKAEAQAWALKYKNLVELAELVSLIQKL